MGKQVHDKSKSQIEKLVIRKMFFKTISNKRAFSRKSQNEPTAKQQQQVYFSIIEAILKLEEEKPKICNKLQSLFP